MDADRQNSELILNSSMLSQFGRRLNPNRLGKTIHLELVDLELDGCIQVEMKIQNINISQVFKVFIKEGTTISDIQEQIGDKILKQLQDKSHSNLTKQEENGVDMVEFINENTSIKLCEDLILPYEYDTGVEANI